MIFIKFRSIYKYGIIIFILFLCASCNSKRSQVAKPNVVPGINMNSKETVRFSYSEVNGIGIDSVYNRRDPSDIIKVGNKYYVWYSRMDSPITPGYWATI